MRVALISSALSRTVPQPLAAGCVISGGLDREFVEDHAEDIVPRTDSDLFSAAWNSYTGANHWFEPAFETLKPYHLHAIDLLVEAGSKEGPVEATSTAAYVASFYMFGDGDIQDDQSLIAVFYSFVLKRLAWSV